MRALFVAFGLYLLVGAGFTAYTGKWFVGFPPQLDLAFLVFGEGALGAYVEAAIAGVLGLGVLALALLPRRTSKER